MKETELAQQVIAWLDAQNWTIYQEVQFSYMGGVADIVAVRNGILWIIESKNAYTLDVLNQASRWPAHYRSVAVPWSRSDRDYRVARDYYLVGVITVRAEFADVYEAVKAPGYLKHDRDAKKMIGKLTDLHKTFAIAGSQGGSQLTPYKQTMIEVRKVIEKTPGCTVGFIYESLGTMHYSSMQSFKGNLIKCLEHFEKWCAIDRSSKPYKLYVVPGAEPIHSFAIKDFL